MLRKYQPKTLGLAAAMVAAVMLVAALGATAAQAAEGPNWIHGAGKALLVAGEKLTIDSESQGEVTLLSTFANILCKLLLDKGELFGGKPGTDLEELEFLECHVEGKTVAECAATSSGMTTGEILTNVLTALAYPLGGEAGNVAYDSVFPDGSNEEFVEFTLSGTNCGLLGGKVKVLAIGKPLIKEVNKEAFEAQCGELGELGILNSGGSFEPIGPGVVEEDGVVKFPAETGGAVVHSAALFFEGKFQAITCELEVNAALNAKGSEDAIVLVEVLNAKGEKEPLGWER